MLNCCILDFVTRCLYNAVSLMLIRNLCFMKNVYVNSMSTCKVQSDSMQKDMCLLGLAKKTGEGDDKWKKTWGRGSV